MLKFRKTDNFDRLENIEEDDENSEQNLCMDCGCENESMEYCSSGGCDVYLCSSCYITISSGDIICTDCADNCFCCNQIINISDIESNTDITCAKCYNEGTYCELCVDKYHLYSCNLGVCHMCTDKCIGCQTVTCCNKTFRTTGLCEMCVLFQLKDFREYTIRDILKNVICDDVIDIVCSYC